MGNSGVFWRKLIVFCLVSVSMIGGKNTSAFAEDKTPTQIIREGQELLAMSSAEFAQEISWRRFRQVKETIQRRAQELCQIMGFSKTLSFSLKRSFTEDFNSKKVYEIQNGSLHPSVKQYIWNVDLDQYLNRSMLNYSEMETYGHLFHKPHPASFPHRVSHLFFSEVSCE